MTGCRFPSPRRIRSASPAKPVVPGVDLSSSPIPWVNLAIDVPVRSVPVSVAPFQPAAYAPPQPAFRGRSHRRESRHWSSSNNSAVNFQFATPWTLGSCASSRSCPPAFFVAIVHRPVLWLHQTRSVSLATGLAVHVIRDRRGAHVNRASVWPRARTRRLIMLLAGWQPRPALGPPRPGGCRFGAASVVSCYQRFTCFLRFEQGRVAGETMELTSYFPSHYGPPPGCRRSSAVCGLVALWPVCPKWQPQRELMIRAHACRGHSRRFAAGGSKLGAALM